MKKLYMSYIWFFTALLLSVRMQECYTYTYITLLKYKERGVNEYYSIYYIYNFYNNNTLKINRLGEFLCITFCYTMYNFYISF